MPRVTLNTFESSGACFTSDHTGLFFGCASPISHSRIEAIIRDIEAQSENSINTLRALREEYKHG